MHVGALAGIGEIRGVHVPSATFKPMDPETQNQKPDKALNPKSHNTPQFLNSFGKRAETVTSTGAASALVTALQGFRASELWGFLGPLFCKGPNTQTRRKAMGEA